MNNLCYSPTRTVHVDQIIGTLTRLHIKSDDKKIQLLSKEAADFSSLESLSLEMMYLTQIPSSMLSMMSLLAELRLYNCPGLQFPENFPPSLQSLEIREGSCKEIPEAIVRSVSLRKLVFENCRAVSELHPSIWHLSSLHSLTLRNLTSLVELLDTIGGLASLKFLCLEGCKNLISLGKTFCWLGSLKILDIDTCFQLRGMWENEIKEI